jgi:hypothetical protein
MVLPLLGQLREIYWCVNIMTASSVQYHDIGGYDSEVRGSIYFQTLPAIYQYCVAPHLEGVSPNPLHVTYLYIHPLKCFILLGRLG